VANEYATREELKTWLSIEATDISRDGLLDRALAAASRGIDKATGRTRGFWLDPEPTARVYRLDGRTVWRGENNLLLVDEIGSSTGLLVEASYVTSWSTVTDFETTPDNALADGRPVTGLLRPGRAWGLASTRIRVTARFGWPEIPDDITEACLIQASRLFKRKDSPEGVMGSSEWGVVRLSRRDPDVWNLIEPYRLDGFG